jgi:plastocyanin
MPHRGIWQQGRANILLLLNLKLKFCETKKSMPMIKKSTLTILSVIIFTAANAATYTVTTSGLSYTPSVVNAMVGDTVVFQGTPNHPTREVSQATWNSNGTTALPGGFDFPSGSGMVVLTAQGTRYYVCTSHVSSGMKGQINVISPSSIGNIITALNNKGMVYPNPAISQMSIIGGSAFVSKNVTLNIFDMTGRMVYSQNFMTGIYGDIITDVSFLQQGIYLAEIKAAENRRVFRFQKVNVKN